MPSTMKYIKLVEIKPIPELGHYSSQDTVVSECLVCAKQMESSIDKGWQEPHDTLRRHMDALKCQNGCEEQ